LLARLEFQPDGWRKLALSFVEQRVLGEVCRAATTPSVPALATVAVPPTRRGGISRGRLATLCAAVLAAFGAGWMWSSRTTQPGLASDPAVAVTTTHTPPTRVPPTFRPAGDARQTASETTPAQPAMFVNWSWPGSEPGIDVPVYAAPSGLTDWQPFAEPVLSPAEVDALRQAGYQVSSQRDVLRLQSQDGHTVALPVEALSVRMSRY
jgi:hypothetical protein